MVVARYAVMGHPVAHSLSPVIHHLFAEQVGRQLVYEKIQIDLPRFEEQVVDFFHQGGMGLNITLPCKPRAFAMSAQVSARALEAQAANTLWMEAGCLHADNTDGVGLLRDIRRYEVLTGKNILLLGAGGAARGILGPLLMEKPAELIVCNRTIERARQLQRLFPGITICTMTELPKIAKKNVFDVVINATPSNFQDDQNIFSSMLSAAQPFCYDLFYRHDEATAFVALARSVGCMAVDGLGMLVEQAAESFFIWHRIMPNTTPVLDYLLHKRTVAS